MREQLASICVSTNHLQEFISFNEPYIESVTGHYACAVSALLACGAYYNAVDYTDIAGDYMDIWDSTGTTVSSESGGITYGSTTIGNIGPGFVDFCAGKNVSVTQNTDYSPNYNFFSNCIDRGDIAVVHCGIISSDTGERAGHSMAAEGYATLRAYNSGNTVHTLMVFDGWLFAADIDKRVIVHTFPKVYRIQYLNAVACPLQQLSALD